MSTFFRTQLLSDIVGPGNIIGHAALLFATLLIIGKPSTFKGIANAMAALVIAVGYALSSVVAINRTGADQDDNIFTQQDLLYATCMSSLALAFSAASMLCRGMVAHSVHRHRQSQDMTVVHRKRKIAASYMMFFMLAEAACIAFNVWAAIIFPRCTQCHDPDRPVPTIIANVTDAVLIFQVLYVLYSYVAVFNANLKDKRRTTVVISFIAGSFPFIIMCIGWGRWQININFGDWSYGQTFSAATGIAALLSTFMDWFADTDLIGAKEGVQEMA